MESGEEVCGRPVHLDLHKCALCAMGQTDADSDIDTDKDTPSPGDLGSRSTYVRVTTYDMSIAPPPVYLPSSSITTVLQLYSITVIVEYSNTYDRILYAIPIVP